MPAASAAVVNLGGGVSYTLTQGQVAWVEFLHTGSAWAIADSEGVIASASSVVGVDSVYSLSGGATASTAIADAIEGASWEVNVSGSSETNKVTFTVAGISMQIVVDGYYSFRFIGGIPRVTLQAAPFMLDASTTALMGEARYISRARAAGATYVVPDYTTVVIENTGDLDPATPLTINDARGNLIDTVDTSNNIYTLGGNPAYTSSSPTAVTMTDWNISFYLTPTTVNPVGVDIVGPVPNRGASTVFGITATPSVADLTAGPACIFEIGASGRGIWFGIDGTGNVALYTHDKSPGDNRFTNVPWPAGANTQVGVVIEIDVTGNRFVRVYWAVGKTWEEVRVSDKVLEVDGVTMDLAGSYANNKDGGVGQISSDNKARVAGTNLFTGTLSSLTIHESTNVHA